MDMNWSTAQDKDVATMKVAEMVNAKTADDTAAGEKSEGGGKMLIGLFRPMVFDDVQQMGSMLKSGHSVVVDYSYMGSRVAWCTFNFMSGLIYCLDGSCEKIIDKLFVYTPKNVALTRMLAASDLKLTNPYK